MTAKNVADMPWVAQLNDAASGVFARVGKVPLRFWRMAVMAIALIWIVHTLAHLVWVVIPAPKMPDAPVVAISSTTASSNTSANVNVDAVVAAHLFGKYVEPTVVVDTQPAAIEDKPIENTKLNVTLEGVIAGSDPEFSSAIIARNSKQTIYKVGEELEGLSNVTVESIEPLRVVLNNRGKPEALWLYGEDGQKFATSRASYTPPARSSTPEPAPERSATFSRDQVSDVKTISDVVRFMVATENGQMIGYKVRPGRKRELFEQAGLKTNDIVVSVNGIQVNEPQKVREVYQALKNATEANLEVLRDGATQTIQISMSSEG